jgi:hypothetical protein
MYIKEGVQMVVRENKRIKVKRINETRSNDISVMIDEGGLGADQYYQIIKENTNTSEAHLHQFEHEVSEKTNEFLIDLLIVNAQESSNKDYNEAIKVIKAELLHRLE